MGRKYSHIIMCGLQSTEVLEFWWSYHTNLSTMGKGTYPKLSALANFCRHHILCFSSSSRTQIASPRPLCAFSIDPSGLSGQYSTVSINLHISRAVMESSCRNGRFSIEAVLYPYIKLMTCQSISMKLNVKSAPL